MTDMEIRAGIEALKPWFHNIDLGGGLTTKAVQATDEGVDHPRPTWEIVRQSLPEDLTGKTVLDVGCNAGFYSIEAKRRNASRVLGVDSQRLPVRQAAFVANALGLDLEYRRLSVYDLSPEKLGQFDIVLALGLIYHCRHLINALDRLFLVTRDLLILESAVLPATSTFPPSLEHLGGLARTFYPVAYVASGSSAKEAVYNWFVPGPEGLVAMLRDTGFVEVTVASIANGRAVVTCRKPTVPLDSSSAPYYLTAELTLANIPATTLEPNSMATFTVVARNTSRAVWLHREPSGQRGMVRLGAHLLSPSGDVIEWDFGRQALPNDVQPGESVTLEIALRIPASPGKYVVEFDFVSEHLAWFEDAGGTLPSVELDVHY